MLLSRMVMLVGLAFFALGVRRWRYVRRLPPDLMVGLFAILLVAGAM